jgi:hypothetical protein
MGGVVDRAKVLRSKNAGPFVITLDVIFGREADFEAVRSVINPALLAEAYAVPVRDVVGIDFVPQLYAMKASFRRRLPCGHPGDPDCYGMNQEQPLARLLDRLVSD